MIRRVRIAIGWVFLIGGVSGAVLSALHVIGRGEPQLVLQLSWFALIFEGFNATQIAHDAAG